MPTVLRIGPFRSTFILTNGMSRPTFMLPQQMVNLNFGLILLKISQEQKYKTTYHPGD